MSEVRVRIAPSPTGFLHVGTARTALFNYLFARRHGGKFILRIEDTDLERSKPEFTHNIYESLKALNLNWDEGPDIGGPCAPYSQSERLALYQDWAQRLLAEGKAYRCYHTQAELDDLKEQVTGEEAFVDPCRDEAARNALAAQKLPDGTDRPASIRFRIPDGRGLITFNDRVRGEVSFDSALMSDFVILKSDGTASYNFAVVVDDHLMRISHVIRGEDHISNTPRQILLYEAMGAPLPEFAHVSMILAPDRSKLSKRHGAVAVSDYIRQGYLPEAFCNFIALLGWSPPDGEEVAPLAHFTEQFSLDRINPSAAIFEKDKLNFINGKYIRALPLEELLERARPYLYNFDLSLYPQEKLLMMLEAVREPITVLSELPEALSYFFGQNVILDAQLVGEVLTGDEPATVLQRFRDFVQQADFGAPDTIAPALKGFTDSLKPIKTKTVMWTVRAAVTGRVHGADLSRTLYLLGRDTVLQRVETALTLTTGSPA